jgi:hypothetical protein
MSLCPYSIASISPEPYALLRLLAHRCRQLEAEAVELSRH